jgi:hypothetical protein
MDDGGGVQATKPLVIEVSFKQGQITIVTSHRL